MDMEEFLERYSKQQLSDKRFMILPTGGVAWETIFPQMFPHVKMKPNKKFLGTFDDCLAKMTGRHGHRLFHITMPFGTLLLDGGWMRPEIGKLCQEYSSENICQVVWLQGFDPFYCEFPAITAWENGEIIRHHAPGLLEKQASYLEKGFIDRDTYERVVGYHKSIGEPLPCEKSPGTLAILDYYQWRDDVLMRPDWKMMTTNFD